MSFFMKIFNLVFILLFLVSAGLQYNDPDPLVWIAIYLYGALACFLSITGRYNLYLYTAGMCVYLSYAAYLFFCEDGVLSWMTKYGAESIVQSMEATKPWIEITREFFGLLILIIVTSANAVRLPKLTFKTWSVNR